MSKLFAFLLLFACEYCTSQPSAVLVAGRVQLPNGWSLTPAGSSLQLGDLPLNMAVSSSKKYIAVTNNGQSVQSIQLIDPVSDKILDSVIIAKSWFGLKFSADEKKLYASGGNDNWILQYAIRNNKLLLEDSISLGEKWPVKISPAGIEIDDKQHRMYVVTKENNSLYVIDLLTKKGDQTIAFGSRRLCLCALAGQERTLYYLLGL